jgi:hypothetical protein
MIAVLSACPQLNIHASRLPTGWAQPVDKVTTEGGVLGRVGIQATLERLCQVRSSLARSFEVPPMKPDTRPTRRARI